MTDATHLLKQTAMHTMPDAETSYPTIRCALDERPSHSESRSEQNGQATQRLDPPFLSAGSKQVCADPPIWIFDGLLSEKVMQHVDSAFEHLDWQLMNGRLVRMVELAVDEQLEELTTTLRTVSHIEDVTPSGKAWIMDVIGRNQGPHVDGWEVEKSREAMGHLDLTKCSVQCHNGFNTVIPSLSFVIYFNDVGGCAFPRADLADPIIPAKRGRIVMFSNYDDAHRPAHNPKAVHYGVYGDGFKRVMTAGVMSGETPPQLRGPEYAQAPLTKGFLYAPIMHRSNTSCGNVSDNSPVRPAPPPPPPKEKPVLQLFARRAEEPKTYIIEARNMGGTDVAKVLVYGEHTWAWLKSQIKIDAHFVCDGQVLTNTLPNVQLKKTCLLQGLEEEQKGAPAPATKGQPAAAGAPAPAKKRGPAAAAAAARIAEAEIEITDVETLVEWDVIDTVFAKKEAAASSDSQPAPRRARSPEAQAAATTKEDVDGLEKFFFKPRS